MTKFETYVPYSQRTVNDVDPQRNPELFSDEDLKREIKMLLGMNKRYGTHVLRVAAYLKIAKFIEDRNAS